jgi:hypothetical protein
VATAILDSGPTPRPSCGYVPPAAPPLASTVGHHAGTTRKIEAPSDFDLIDAGHFVLDFAGQRAEHLAEGWCNCPCAGSLAEHPGECGRTCYWDNDLGDCPTCHCRCSLDCGCPCAEVRENEQAAEPVVERAPHTCVAGVPCAPWHHLASA